VPPKPKEFTPTTESGATRAVARRVATARFSPSKSISGLGSAKWREGGIAPRSSISMPLSSPAMPEPASRWPTLVLTEPIGSGAARRCAMVVPIAQVSAGSPTRVPVPCASKARKRSGATPARAITRSISAACAARSGSDRPMVRPAALAPLPSSTARMRAPSARASARRRSTTTPAPSART